MKQLFSLIVIVALMVVIGCGDSNRRPPVADTRVIPGGLEPYATATPAGSPSAAAPKPTYAPLTGPRTMSPAMSPAAAVTYVCPMHPEVTSDKPGKCPKCGMVLVVKK